MKQIELDEERKKEENEMEQRVLDFKALSRTKKKFKKRLDESSSEKKPDNEQPLLLEKQQDGGNESDDDNDRSLRCFRCKLFDSYYKGKEQRNALYEKSHYSFLKYGVGIVTYFDIIFRIQRLLFVISFLALAQMGLYWAIGGYGNIVEDIGFYALTSFGNMGFSKSICSKQLINWNSSILEMNF